MPAAPTRPAAKTKSKAGPPTDRGAQRAEEILDVALRLFVEQGYTNVTIKDLARVGRMNPALVYYYYHNKEDLFLAALRHAVEQALATRNRFTEADRDDPVALIRLWFETNAKFAKPITQILMLMLDYRASKRRSTSVQRLITRFYETEMDLLSGAVERGIATGVFRSVDTRKVALFVSTHLDGLIVASTIRSEVDLKKSLREFQEILFDYLGFDRATKPAAKPAEGDLRDVA